jgi:hypothetical protein
MGNSAARGRAARRSHPGRSCPRVVHAEVAAFHFGASLTLRALPEVGIAILTATAEPLSALPANRWQPQSATLERGGVVGHVVLFLSWWPLVAMRWWAWR